MALFDTIGETYNKTRAADGRIVDELVRLLGLPEGAVIADIGAGSGNYANVVAARGYYILAVEPSEVMRAQAVPSPRVKWHAGAAEQLPLADASVDGVIMTLAIHHFSNLHRALSEIVRISPSGPIVIFTFDPREGEKTWIGESFPSIWGDAFRAFPPVQDVAELLGGVAGRNVEITPFPLPHDLTDNFAAAGWRYPHRYLDEAYRNNMSPFRLSDQMIVAKGVERLSADLQDGTWSARHGDILQYDRIDAGYRFLRVMPVRAVASGGEE